MYADRHAPKPIDRGSLTLSIAIVGGLVAVAALSNTVIDVIRHDSGITVIPVAPVPPPPPPNPDPEARHADPMPSHPIQVDPVVPTIPFDPPFRTSPDPGPPPIPGTGDGGGVVVDPPKPPPPILRGADVDGRYARDFQPVYPNEERRAGREGVVTLKVLIGTDGRVREVARIAAASDAFWRVTQDRALAKWRFRPATRDGVPYETWKTMTVRFRLEEE